MSVEIKYCINCPTGNKEILALKYDVVTIKLETKDNK